MCEFIHDLYIAGIYRPRGYVFAADSMDLSSLTLMQRALEKVQNGKVVHDGHWWSSKFVPYAVSC